MIEAPPVAATPEIPSPAMPAKSLLGAVFLLGTLLSLPGILLPVWGYHRLEAFELASYHFLAMALGFLIGNAVSALACSRYPGLFLKPLFGAFFSIAGIAMLALLPPPYPVAWQLASALCLGVSAGSLLVIAFHHIGAFHRFNSPAVFQLTGLVALTGALAAPLAAAWLAIPTGSLSLLALIALPAAVAVGSLGKARPGALPATSPLPFAKAIEDFRNPATILLALLLFFQMGNEIALLGWLPVFLIQRVGMSPTVAVYGMAAFVFVLLAGRTASQAMRERARRNRVLLGGLSLSVLGCLMLLSTNNAFGAFLGLSLAGIGFSPVFPMVLALMTKRFPYYHAGVMNAIFATGLLGGLLAPFSVGVIAGKLGIGIAMALPIAGSLLVAVLVLLLWMESRLTGSTP